MFNNTLSFISIFLISAPAAECGGGGGGGFATGKDQNKKKRRRRKKKKEKKLFVFVLQIFADVLYRFVNFLCFLFNVNLQYTIFF